MPYINKIDRSKYTKFLTQLNDKVMNEGITVGELNYLVSSLSLLYTKYEGNSYTTLNSVVGVLESAKLEFYRRLVAEYENAKINEHGDVY